MSDSRACPVCDSKDVAEVSAVGTRQWRDAPPVEVKEEFWHCNACGEEFVDFEQTEHNQTELLLKTIEVLSDKLKNLGL